MQCSTHRRLHGAYSRALRADESPKVHACSLARYSTEWKEREKEMEGHNHMQLRAAVLSGAALTRCHARACCMRTECNETREMHMQ